MSPDPKAEAGGLVGGGVEVSQPWVNSVRGCCGRREAKNCSDRVGGPSFFFFSHHQLRTAERPSESAASIIG